LGSLQWIEDSLFKDLSSLTRTLGRIGCPHRLTWAGIAAAARRERAQVDMARQGHDWFPKS
jgi:hypothetical protein